MLNHSPAHVVTELFHLFPNVAEEGVARPSADEHDGVYGNFGEIHGHRGPQAYGVCADVGWFEA